MKITLFLDTSNSKKTIVKLVKGKKEFEEIFETDTPRADVALELIQTIFKKAQVTQEEITHISVNKGPGSYTGVRIGVSIANALSFALGIPVNDKKVSEIEEAIY